MTEIDEACDLSDVQRDVLKAVGILSKEQPLPQGSEIKDEVNGDRSEKKRVDETHIYDTLHWLAARQLITTQQSDEDNRVKQHVLTEHGLSTLQTLSASYPSVVDEEPVTRRSEPSGSETPASKPVSDGGAVRTACSAGNSRYARQMQAAGAAKDLRNLLAASDEAITLAQAAKELNVPRSLVEDLVDDDDNWFVETTKKVNEEISADAVEPTEAAVKDAIKDPFSGVEQ